MYDKIELLIEEDNVPNILFYGNYGVGKKRVLKYMLDKIYYGVTNKQQYILFVNCAYNKGIQFIRDEIKFFSKINSIHKFKSIILTNIDKLTIEAQSALRRCIELYNHNTRFFVVINNKKSIMKPILSRFSHIHIEDDNYYHLYNNKLFGKENRNFNVWLNKNIETIELHKFVNYCYLNSITYNDILNYIESKDIKNKYLLLIELNKWKNIIRNEKLLLLYSIIYYRSFI